MAHETSSREVPIKGSVTNPTQVLAPNHRRTRAEIFNDGPTECRYGGPEVRATKNGIPLAAKTGRIYDNPKGPLYVAAAADTVLQVVEEFEVAP